jgi:tetratricopeptide (TPR) repeat protein
MLVADSTINTEIFSATLQQPAQLESLGNTALTRGIDLFMRKDFKGAVKEFQRAIGLAPQSSYSIDAAHYMADAYLALDDPKNAVKAYQTAIRLNPNRDDSHLKLGNLFFSEERFSEAATEYEKAVNLWPNAENRFALGQAYMNMGRYSDAENQFNKVLRMEPRKPDGHYGLGLNAGRQGRYEEAIGHFESAIRLDKDFYAAYAEMGYAHADLGQIDEAVEIVSDLKERAPEIAETLSNYIYEVDPPKILFSYTTSSSFQYYMPAKTPVSSLDAYLQTANASKTFTMKFQFDKQMERSEVEAVTNWQIGRSSGYGPGQVYNYGLPVPETEVKPLPIPVNVYYDAEEITATVYFKIQQNATADGTIDPSHIEFRFNGKDAFGLKMNPDFDQFTGFSKVY